MGNTVLNGVFNDGYLTEGIPLFNRVLNRALNEGAVGNV